MKYFALAFAAIFALTGCVEEGSDITNHHSTITVCLGGVEYWLISPETTLQALAPKIDTETLNFVRCEVKE